jgi:hypothetical protein
MSKIYDLPMSPGPGVDTVVIQGRAYSAEAVADVLLMAAAPELLAALEATHEFISDHYEWFMQDTDSDSTERLFAGANQSRPQQSERWGVKP